MNKKSFFLGILTGVGLSIIGIVILGAVMNNNSDLTSEDDPIQYLEKPVSYENKTETSFKVLQVLGNAALAIEESDEIGGEVMYLGNTALILGENFYTDQIIKIKNPQRIGTYNYITQQGSDMTVPVIDVNKK